MLARYFCRRVSVRPSVRPCVCLSVCHKPALNATQDHAYDSQGTLVF